LSAASALSYQWLPMFSDPRAARAGATGFT